MAFGAPFLLVKRGPRLLFAAAAALAAAGPLLASIFDPHSARSTPSTADHEKTA